MKQTRWMCAALILLTAACFAHVYFSEFIHLDDPLYVARNAFVRDGLTWTDIKWAFTDSSYRAGYWVPLTWMSLQTDASLFGPDAAYGFHLTNLLWHVVNVVLFFRGLHRMTGEIWRSAIAAALFAIHPLRVESVAWVTERKDMLSTTFLIFTVGAYFRYASQPTVGRYALVAAAYLCGLMSKPTLVTLPFLLLLLDYWPLYRLRLGQQVPRTWRSGPGVSWKTLIAEKLPLVAMALASSWLTMYLSSQMGAVTSQVPWGDRLSVAVSAYVTYLEKTFWPTNLAVLYPFYVPSPGRVVLAAAILLVVTGAVIYRAKQNPAVIVGWLWFLFALVPNIGFVQAGPQAFADRFTYIPHLGLLVAIVWAIGDWEASHQVSSSIKRVAIAMMLIVLATLTWIQVWYWRNSETLFVHSLRVAGDSYHLRLNLSLFWLERGDLDLAEEQAAKAVEVDAPDGGGRLAYGSILWRQAKYDEAIGQLQKYLHSHPDNPDANYYLGRIFAKTGRLEEARQSLEKAIENWPAEPTVDFFLGDMEDRRATAHQVLGEIHLRQGRPHLALTHLQLAEKSKPQLAAAQDFFVGISLGRLKRWPEAEHRFLKFLEKEPNNDACRGYLAFAYARQGKKDWADRTYADLMTRNPDWLKTSNEAAMKLITKKQWLDRKMADELALQSCEATNFKNAVALEVLAAVSASSGEFGKAREIAANALKLTIDNALRQRLQERLGLYERNQALPIE